MNGTEERNLYLPSRWIQDFAAGQISIPVRHLFRWTVLLVLSLLAASPAAFAHATLVRSSPADRAVIHSSTVDIALDYNSRIETSRCTLILTDTTGKRFPLRMEPGTNPAELKAVASNLPDGTYRIHWQVLATDGHITRGDVSFTVAVH